MGASTRSLNDSEPGVRESIGKIGTIEAGEMLLMVLRQEEGTLRDVAKRSLASFDNADVLPIMRQYFQLETNADARQVIEDLLGRAGTMA